MNHLAEVEGEAVALLFLLVVALMSAALSWFLDYLLEHHPIGSWYLSKLQELPENIAKPLGECVYCSGAWQYLVLSILLFKIPVWLSIFGLGANHLFLKLLQRILNPSQHLNP